MIIKSCFDHNDVVLYSIAEDDPLFFRSCCSISNLLLPTCHLSLFLFFIYFWIEKFTILSRFRDYRRIELGFRRRASTRGWRYSLSKIMVCSYSIFLFFSFLFFSFLFSLILMLMIHCRQKNCGSILKSKDCGSIVPFE